MGAIINNKQKSGKPRLQFLHRSRILLQLATLAAMTVPAFSAKGVCTPVFWCHGCPASTMACPIGAILNFSQLGIFPFLTAGILGLVGTFGGRIVCGWLCPFGMLQDWLYKIRSKKYSIPVWTRYIKYAMLVGLVIGVPYFFPAFEYHFCKICPNGTLTSMLPYAAMGITSGDSVSMAIRIGILIGMIVFAIGVSRGFCRVCCPLGAIFSLFNKFSLYRFELTHHECNGCSACNKLCPTEMDPVGEMNGAECIKCYNCTATGHIKIGTK